MTLVQSKPQSLSPVDDTPIRYEDDVHGWALQQAELLRAGRMDEIDLTNIADEIDDVAGWEYDKLESALMRVIQHLLKWDYQPQRRSASWMLTIREHRRRVSRQLRKHPGLRSELPEAMAAGFEDGRDRALKETRLNEAVIPESNPYSWDDIMNREIAWLDE